jgi:hypothetical protein
MSEIQLRFHVHANVRKDQTLRWGNVFRMLLNLFHNNLTLSRVIGGGLDAMRIACRVRILRFAALSFTRRALEANFTRARATQQQQH